MLGRCSPCSQLLVSVSMSYPAHTCVNLLSRSLAAVVKQTIPWSL